MYRWLSIAIVTALAHFSMGQTYNFYRGNLHAHTGYSDGNSANLPYYSTAYNCYQYADSSLYFDFLGISEHNHNGAGMVLANYANGVAQADMATNPGFLALYGMEWGTISGGGHVVIYGVDSLMGWEAGNYSIYTAYGDYNNLFNMVKNRPASFSYLAHPDVADYNSLFASPYNSVNDQAIIGSAVRSGPAFSTNTTYTNPSTFSYYQRYKDLLALGYHVGPLMDHDNHYITFGRTTPARTVVLAQSLTKTDLFSALKSMRFYASDDWNVEVNYTINTTNYMGSTVVSSANPTFQITVNDPDGGDAINYIRIRYAIQNGGNTSPAILTSTTTNTLTFTHNITNLSAYYYYLEISQTDGDMIYTAPIWYTKDQSLPVELIDFSATSNTNNRTVLAQWSTASEHNSSHFLLERSTDNEHWLLLDTIKATGTSETQQDYQLLDKDPTLGLNYYRLSQFDIDGSLKDQRTISLQSSPLKHFDLFPNPTYDVIYLEQGREIQFDRYVIFNASGNKIEEGPLSANLLAIDVSAWEKGTYYIHVHNAQLTETASFVVE